MHEICRLSQGFNVRWRCMTIPQAGQTICTTFDGLKQLHSHSTHNGPATSLSANVKGTKLTLCKYDGRACKYSLAQLPAVNVAPMCGQRWRVARVARGGEGRPGLHAAPRQGHPPRACARHPTGLRLLGHFRLVLLAPKAPSLSL